jgi:hypothetical protein
MSEFREASTVVRAGAALRRVLMHPSWSVEYARRLTKRGRVSGNGDFSLDRYREYTMGEEEAVRNVLELGKDDYRRLRGSLWMPDPEAGDETAWSSRVVLLRTIGVAVRALRPDAMIETGVERGYSAAVALAAMRENGSGRLFSVDLPRLEVDPATFTGRLIPEHLRAGWELSEGPSRQILPKLTARLGEVDIFLHDSDHSYSAQMAEYQIVWPALRRGGLLVSDDVWNSALLDFAREVGEEPVLIPRAGSADAVGLLRRH